MYPARSAVPAAALVADPGPWRWSLYACLLLCLPGVAVAEPEHYARCAACHLDDGEGVPGIFPPLAGHVERFFASVDGRAYLSRLVIGGTSGVVEVRGMEYRGNMPAVVADLSDVEVADLLNYLVERFGVVTPPAAPRFLAKDVANARRAGPLSGEERASWRQRVLSGSASR